MTTSIAVTGVAPAVGKSTVALHVARLLRDHGRRVDLIEEDELLTRPEYAPVARELAATAHVRLETLLDSTSSVLAGHADNPDDFIVWDDLLPFVSVLLGWRYDGSDIADFLEVLATRMAGTHAVVVYLDASVPNALRLAAAREPDHYLEWYIETLERRDIGPLVHGIESAAHYLEWERSLTMRLLEEHGWEVLYVGGVDLLPVEHLRVRAQTAISPLLQS